MILFASRILFAVFIGYCMILDSDINAEDSWWKSEVAFSDWRNVKCDYSTNAVVNWYYNGKGSKYYRDKQIKEIRERLLKGDTLVIAIDYYGVTYSKNIVPKTILEQNVYALQRGYIIRFRVTAIDSLYQRWERIY